MFKIAEMLWFVDIKERKQQLLALNLLVLLLPPVNRDTLKVSLCILVFRNFQYLLNQP